MIVLYTSKAEADLKALPIGIKARILDKVDWYCQQKDPLKFSITLSGSGGKLHRFRIGNYRAIFMISNGAVSIAMIISVRHRREVYD